MLAEQGPSVPYCHTLPGSLSSFQVWEETYQRVANEQEIYEGTGDPALPPRVPCACTVRVAVPQPTPPAPSPAPRLAAAAAGEQLPEHHHQANRTLRPLHRQSEGAAGAQVRGAGAFRARGDVAHGSHPSHHRLQEPQEPKEEQAQMLLKICDDNEMVPR